MRWLCVFQLCVREQITFNGKMPKRGATKKEEQTGSLTKSRVHSTLIAKQELKLLLLLLPSLTRLIFFTFGAPLQKFPLLGSLDQRMPWVVDSPHIISLLKKKKKKKIHIFYVCCSNVIWLDRYDRSFNRQKKQEEEKNTDILIKFDLSKAVV